MKKLLLTSAITPAYLLLAKVALAAPTNTPTPPAGATRIELCATGQFDALCHFTVAMQFQQ